MKEKQKLSPRIFLIKTIRIIVIAYITILIFLFVKQKDMLYYYDYPRESSFYSCYNFNNDEKKQYNGTRFYERKGTNNNIIVFFHGNAGAACDRYDMKNLLEKSGNNFIFVEYNGYSDPDNKNPNLKNILQDTINIGKYLKTKNYENVYIMGRSIGTGPASYYAQNFRTDKLLLISPYAQLYKVAKEKYPIFPIKLMFSENYKSEEYLKNYKNDLLIIHGKNDKIVPFHHGEELYNLINSQNKEFLEVNNGDHNNLLGKKEVNKKILEFLE